MRRFSILTLPMAVLSLALPEAAAQQVPCGSNIGKSEIAIDLAGVWANLRIYDRNGMLSMPDLSASDPSVTGTTVQIRTPVSGACDFFVGFPPNNGTDGRDRHVYYGRDVILPATVEIERLTVAVPGRPSTTIGISRFIYSADSSATPGAFFRPINSAGGGNGDVYFLVDGRGVHVSPDDFWNSRGGAGLFVDDVIPDDGWVYPYHRGAICAAEPCGTPVLNAAPQQVSVPFVMPVDTVFVIGQPLTKRLTSAASMLFSPDDRVGWTEGWLTLAFAPGTGIETQGTFNASGVTLTASNAAQGWGGLRVAGGHATLGAGTTISGVGAPAGFGGSNTAGVTVTSGSATLDGAIVQGTTGGAGVYVSGASASATIRGETEIFSNASGPGLRVDAGGLVTVDGDDVQIYGNAEGVVATGSGSRAQVHGGLIRNNAGPGLRATSGARIDVLRAIGGGSSSLTSTSTDPVRLTSNTGGLYATGTGKQAGGVVNTEAPFVCVQAPCPVTGQHDFRTNNLGPAFDASARSGSQVLATYNYWGTSIRANIQTDEDSSSVVSIDPILTAPPSAGLLAGRAASNGSSAFGRSPALGRGHVDAGVQALIAEADAWVPSGDSVRAGERLLGAWALATTDDDRLAVAEAAGRALRVVQPPALVGWAVGAAGPAGPDRPWGRRVLARSLAGRGRYAEASAVAQALAGEDGAGTGEVAESHRARGLGLLVEVAVASGDASGAVAALVALADVDPEGAADAALAVVVAFPDVDVTIGAGAAGRGGIAAKAGAPTDAAGDSGLGLAVGPNPSAGVVRVSLTLPGAADAAVTVFDALGRQVAVLHAGAAPAGTLAATFDGAALPAGVYVVRAVVRSAGGASVLTRTVTVAR